MTEHNNQDSRIEGSRSLAMPAEILQHLYEIIQSDQSLNSELSEISSLVRNFLSSDKSSILLLDPDQQNLLFRGASGLNRWEREHIFFELGEGVAGTVAETGESVLVKDIREDDRFKQFSGQQDAMKSIICVPLCTNDQMLGVVCADRTQGSESFAPQDLQKLETIAYQISLAIENHRLAEMTIRDELTELYNRRYFERRFSEELARASRHRLQLSLAMLDIDDFKAINDRYGHPAGDVVLRDLGTLIKDTVRTSDIACRYGGEEIAIIFVETSVNEGVEVVRRILSRVRQKTFEVGDNSFEITLSAGLSELSNRTKSEGDILEHADKNLYKAKNHGKDRCVPPYPEEQQNYSNSSSSSQVTAR